MAWKIELSKQARRDLKNISHENRKRIARFIDERLSTLDDPRAIGKSLIGKLDPRVNRFCESRVSIFFLNRYTAT